VLRLRFRLERHHWKVSLARCVRIAFKATLDTAATRFETRESHGLFARAAIRFSHGGPGFRLHKYHEVRKEGPMTQKLAKAVAIFAIALAPLIGAGTAEAHGGGFGGGGFGGGGFHGGGFHGGGFHGGEFHGGGFRDRDFRGGGFFGGSYPGYYGYGRCYVTIYGTTYCY
jgi:hypothetical protein